MGADGAVNVIFPGPSNVLASVMGLDVVVNEALPLTLTGLANWMELAELSELLKRDGPGPV